MVFFNTFIPGLFLYLCGWAVSRAFMGEFTANELLELNSTRGTFAAAYSCNNRNF